MKFLLLCALMTFAPAAFAAFPEPVPEDDLARIKAQIEDGQPADALKALRPLLGTETFEADVLNLMGYAYRKMGNFTQSRIHYTRALSLDPNHKGALEYMGELELQTSNYAAARDLLQRLQQQCPDGCEELDDLIGAFADADIPVLDPVD